MPDLRSPRKVLEPLPEPETGQSDERLDNELAKINAEVEGYLARGELVVQKLKRHFSAERIYDPDIDAPLKLALAVCLPELGGELRRGHSKQGPTYSVSALRDEIHSGRLAAVSHRGKLMVTRRTVRDWLASRDGNVKPSNEPRREKAVGFVPESQKSHRDAVRAQVATERARAKLDALKIRKPK